MERKTGFHPSKCGSVLEIKNAYKKESFADAWARYLPLGGDSEETGETSKPKPTCEPNETTTSVNGNVSDGQQIQFVPNVSDVSVQLGDDGLIIDLNNDDEVESWSF